GYEGLRLRKGLTRLTTVPTSKMHLGDFSELSTPIVDPTTKTPFPGNMIPNQDFNTLGAKLLSFYPLPNLPGLTANFVDTAKQTRNENLYNIRTDINFSNHDTVFSRFSTESVDGIDPFGGIALFSSQPFLSG